MRFMTCCVSFAIITGITSVTIPQDARAEGGADDMHAFLAGMPKAELHLHIEGSIDPETVVEITNRNDLDYFRTVEEIQESLAARPPGLMGFLEHHYKLQNVMQNRQDFYDATYSLIRNLHENNVIYADLFFDPQAHASRGIAFDEMFDGIDSARRDAEEVFGVTVNLIMCIQRERSVESALEMLDQAHPFRDRIIGLGMDSGPEYGNPPVKFRDVYARARDEGYFLTGHHDVDVRDSLVHIRQSLDIIDMDRIDHGLNASDDPDLMAELVRRDMCLTGSPVKRTTDPALQDVDRITTLDAAGVCVSLNTDDPEEFESGYLTNMLVLFQQESGYSKADMSRLMWNAFRAVWLPDAEKEALVAEFRGYVVANGVDWSKVNRDSAVGGSPQSAAAAFLSLIDQDNYQESWEEASTILRSNVDAEQWAEYAGSYRQPLGVIEQRTINSVEIHESLEDMPPGDYAFVMFDTSLADGGSASEMVGLMLDEDSTWRVIGYQIQ